MKRLSSLIALSFMFVGTALASAPSYTLSIVPTPKGVTGSIATSINDYGKVVGALSYTNGAIHGFIYKNGKTTDIGQYQSQDAGFEPLQVNDKGLIVGVEEIDASVGSEEAVYYDGKFHVLNQPAKCSGLNSLAYAVNNSGDIVGDVCDDGYGDSQAAEWTPGSGGYNFKPLNYKLKGNALLNVWGINYRGSMVGSTSKNLGFLLRKK